MIALQTEDFLLVREAAGGRDPVDQAMTLLARAYPAEPAETLRRLPLGRRNAHLLALRKQLFGVMIEAFAECPQCGQELELSLDADAFPFRSEETASAELALDAGGYTIRFRLLDSSDLRAAAGCASCSDARALLVERCVLDAWHGDDAVPAGALPPDVVERLAERLEECDPLAETLLNLVCPACGSEWQIAFDVASFLITEVEAHARRILREVHALARGYGWREADILAMSARRRRDYLELLL
jgi:hypothetical protein